MKRRTLRHLLPFLLLAAPAAGQHVLNGEVVGLGMDDGELTPDGRYLVTRDTAAFTNAYVWDVGTGQRVATHGATSGTLAAGPALDAVAVTDTRAVVLGSTLMVLDLTAPGTAVLAEYAGRSALARDVALDALGRFAVVRTPQEVQVLRLADGAVALSGPPSGTTDSAQYDVDATVATADHGVATDFDPLADDAGVLVVEFAPSGGGGPRVVHQSPPNERLGGRPHDLAVSPDGQWCAVRSDEEVALFRLDGANTRMVWKTAPVAPVNPFLDSAMDSVVMTDGWVITMGRSASPAGWAIVEAYDLAGGRSFATLYGDPHDLELAPDLGHLALRTSERFCTVDLSTLQVGAGLFVHEVDVHTVVTGFGAGLDSVAVSDTHAAAAFVRGNGPVGRVYRIDGFQPVWVGTVPLDSAPIDVGFTPDGTRAVFTTLRGYSVYDVRTGSVTLSQVAVPTGWWPWCDGLALNDSHAAAFGVEFVHGSGWLELVDLFDEPSAVCASAANSTGAPGRLVATGSSRPAANDLELWALGLPPNAVAMVAYGSPGAPFRYGDGALCLTGPVIGRALTGAANANGVLRIALDQNAVSTGPGTFLAGTSWLFQVVHRDPGGVSGHNATNGVLVPFLN